MVILTVTASSLDETVNEVRGPPQLFGSNKHLIMFIEIKYLGGCLSLTKLKPNQIKKKDVDKHLFSDFCVKVTIPAFGKL